jgi:hypothetical protein
MHLDDFEEEEEMNTNEGNFDYDEDIENDFNANSQMPDDLLPESESDENEEEVSDDEKPADEEEAEGDDQPEADSKELDPRLLLKLGSLGISDEKADKILSLGSNDAIEQMIELLQDGNKGDEAGQQTEEDQKIEDWYELPEGFTDDFDEDLGGALKGINENARNAVSKIQQDFEDRLAQRDFDDFEDALDGMDNDWKRVFGSGDAGSLDQNTDAFKNRAQLYEEVFSGKYKGSVRRRVEQAAKTTFSDDASKIDDQKKVNKARDRNGRFISRGGARKVGSNMNSDQVALSNLTKKFKEMGGYDEGFEDF